VGHISTSAHLAYKLLASQAATVSFPHRKVRGISSRLPLLYSLSILAFLILWHRTLRMCNAQCDHQTLTVADGDLWPFLHDPLNSYLSSSPSTDHTEHLALAQKGVNWNMQLWNWDIACCMSNIRLGCLYHCQKPYLHIVSLEQNSLCTVRNIYIYCRLFLAHFHMLHVSMRAPPPPPFSPHFSPYMGC